MLSVLVLQCDVVDLAYDHRCGNLRLERQVSMVGRCQTLEQFVHTSSSFMSFMSFVFGSISPEILYGNRGSSDEMQDLSVVTDF